MTAIEHNKILAAAFAGFAAIFAFTVILLLVVSLGTFMALGITLANETRDSRQAGIGIMGGAVAIIFYCLLGAVFVLPTALAAWKMWKGRRNARIWGIIAAILVTPMMPLGTMIGIYGLWFFFSGEGRRFYLSVVLVMALALSGGLVRGQGSLGPIPKKPRTLADYEPSTLKEIIALDSDVENGGKEDRVVTHSDLLPFKVSVTYTGSSKPISEKSKAALFRWTQCCAGDPDQFRRSYDTEMRFDENGAAYWLAIRQRSLPDFEKELKVGQLINLYLIRVADRLTDGKRGSVLLVEKFNTSTESRQRSKCLMEPPYPSIEVPPFGFARLKREGLENDCRPARKAWQRQPAETFDLLVHADGPSGSGRYWNITVGLAKKSRGHPDRGFCTVTSTVGWRTLQSFSRPLAWIADHDHDGKPELVLWDSFPLKGDDSTSADYGLVSWVYQVDVAGKFMIDWGLSRKLAAELAAGYRTPLQRADALFRETRQQAARALESFATASCESQTDSRSSQTSGTQQPLR